MTSPSEVPHELSAISGRWAWLAAFGVSLGTALLIVSPFFWLGTASGHDIAFHASSWLEVAGQWKEGILFPRWCEWANNGFGEPRFIFYPPLSWMLGAALGFVVPWTAVPGTFIVLAQTLAGISMFALARRFFPTRAAIFAAACYAANPYALLVVYMRSDFAEELACALLPLLLLAVVQLCGLLENHWRSGTRVTAIFALLFACIWLSNAPAGVLASYSMALFFTWAAIAKKSFAPLWRGAGGLALGFALTGFYLLPAAYEQRWVNIGQALSSGLQPAQNFLYTKIADPEHNQFNWIASSIAVLLIAMAGAAAIVAYRNTQKEEYGGEKSLWHVLLLLGATAMVLMFRSSWILWEFLPKLRFVQFPWRWMGILAVPYAYFAAAAVRRWRPGWVWAVVVTITVVCTAAFLVHKAWWDTDDIPVLEEAISSSKGFDGTDEYDPAKDDHTNLPAKAPPVQILAREGAETAKPSAKIRIARWTAEEKDLTVTSPQPLRLAVRLLDYPVWRVEVNGQRVMPESPESTAQIILPLPAGTQRIKIELTKTPDRILGEVVSGAAGILFLLLLFLDRARRLSPNFRALCAVLMAFLCASLSCAKTQSQGDAIPDRWLMNQDVIEMLRSGLSVRTVIQRIHDSPCKFDKSAEGLEALRAANVPYRVLMEMMQAPELPPPVKGHIPTVIPDSTLVEVVLSESLGTAAQKPGYIVYFRVSQDVRIQGLRVIAKGARARGRLLDSRERSRAGEPARLEWNMMDVEAVDGQRVPLRGGSERAGNEITQEKSVSAEEGEEFRTFTYGSRKVNVPAPIQASPIAPTSSESPRPKQETPPQR